ncbi:MAG: DbpA RNA binding domain-containing protein [Treponema sp.]|jgi:hypothetical protein|nr:DbpA RNA binding domain-containing protein [Treponema sp.]
MPLHINNKERTEKTIEIILEKIHTEADPELLNEYRSLLRKKTSLFNRSYVGAYLLMQLEEGDGGSRRRGGRSAVSRTEVPRDNFRTEPDRSLPEKESARLFFSIGRNRRVFPRELLQLIGTKTQVSRDDVGTIRILDSHSFVQVRSSAADAIIAALNGVSFRGRTLTVNYARNHDAAVSPQEGVVASGRNQPVEAGGAE